MDLVGGRKTHGGSENLANLFRRLAPLKLRDIMDTGRKLIAPRTAHNTANNLELKFYNTTLHAPKNR